MLSLLIAAAAVSAAVDPRLTAPECRVFGRPVAGQMCCESCDNGMVMHTQWVTQQAAVASTALDVEVGSGGVHAESLELAAVAETNVACGKCLSVDGCLALRGHVNTWHRTCTTQAN
jgi:hypothetical protein